MKRILLMQCEGDVQSTPIETSSGMAKLEQTRQAVTMALIAAGHTVYDLGVSNSREFPQTPPIEMHKNKAPTGPDVYLWIWS